LHQTLKKGDLLAYLIHMTLRIVEIHRVLKPTGSFYLHCDPTASHYLKIICDSVFCAKEHGGQFVNEIVWRYGSGGASKLHYSKKHDVIFYYAKSAQWIFNVDAVREPYFTDEQGKFKTVNGKKYLRQNPLGRIPFDWWRISFLNNFTHERLGYDTQKPEALLERIIKASSNEGDVVLDAYCGCGTTIAVAQRLKRRWIGIDITYQSISVILKRLEDSYKSNWPAIESNLPLDGIPKDIESAKALALRKDDKNRKEFEKWAVLTYSNNQARINDKKGADGGVDGIAYFMIHNNQNGKVIFQVKSGQVGRNIIATLNSDRIREKAEFGILITLKPSTKPMREEAKQFGQYKHPYLNRQDDRIQIVTINEIMNKRRMDLPMVRPDAIKSAEAYSVPNLNLFED
jgi:site-specific DNA-methyltransferase (adenine-specific)